MNLQVFLSQTRVPADEAGHLFLPHGVLHELPPKDGVPSLLRGARGQSPSYDDGLTWGQFKDLPEAPFFPLIFHVVTCHNKTDSEKEIPQHFEYIDT